MSWKKNISLKVFSIDLWTSWRVYIFFFVGWKNHNEGKRCLSQGRRKSASERLWKEYKESVRRDKNLNFLLSSIFKPPACSINWDSSTDISIHVLYIDWHTFQLYCVDVFFSISRCFDAVYVDEKNQLNFFFSEIFHLCLKRHHRGERLIFFCIIFYTLYAGCWLSDMVMLMFL